jgi:hypothetical protein
MYNLTRRLPLGRLLVEEVPLAGTALIVAEVLYKFHSFALECLAFLATWYVFDLAADRLRLLRGARGSASMHSARNSDSPAPSTNPSATTRNEEVPA